MSGKKREATRRAPDAAKAAFEDYPRMRIRWIDRLVAVILESPGPPAATAVNQTCAKLLRELESYREGFVHALNISKVKQ